MRETVERETGGLCLFLHGASGDLTPRRSYEASTDAAEQNGRELGFAALTTLSGMLPPAAASITSESRSRARRSASGVPS